MPCKRHESSSPPVLNAVFAGWDDSPLTVDATSSVGVYIRVVVRRDDDIIYTAPYQSNTGANTFDISSIEDDLQNGDTISVIVSNDVGFTVTDEDSRVIPTPGVTSTQLMPNMTFSFEGAPGDDAFLAPSSSGTAILTMVFGFFDTLGNEGTITMMGKKAAFQSIEDSAAWAVLASTGSNTITTSFGNVSVVRAFDAGFEIDLCTHVLGTITDEMGISSAEEYYGITCAIFSANTEYITAEDTDEVVTYLEVPPYSP